jgi:diguanylate cyclase (GGDEF)-like protein
VRVLSKHPRWRPFGFGLRLFLSITASLAIVGVGGYVAMVHELKSNQTETYASAHRADARTFESLSNTEGSRYAALAQIDELLDAIGRRPGTKEATLIDERHVVQSADDPLAIGSTDTDAEIVAALEHGNSYAGTETQAGADHRNFEVVSRVVLGHKRYAFEVIYDHTVLDRQLSSVRRVLVIVGLLALIVGGVVFYLVGGRSLMRSHRIALERATRDGLTDLPNHRAFQADFPRTIAIAERSQGAAALVLLDLDNFKLVNDRHGHPEGDALLTRVAGLLGAGRYGDRAYRLGGDEFALILPHTDNHGARAATHRLQRELSEAGASVSMGVSVLRAGQSVDMLRSEADAALYDAKRRGGKRVAYFEDISEHVVITSSDKREAVHRMIDERGLTMHYQPIWNLSTGELVGVEALARPDEKYGLSGPSEAFDVAERIGRVHELDTLCVQQALRLAADARECPLLFVNLSPHTLELDAEANNWLRTTAQDAGWRLDRVVVEVTERFGARTTAVIQTLERLRAQGFKIALDDVGTGNAGLEMLHRVGADFVKIDRSIVAAAPSEPNARAVLMAMATLARQTGAFVIAEGIEDEETLDYLREVDRSDVRPDNVIQGGQGYGLGRPATEIPHGHVALLPDSPHAQPSLGAAR